MYVCRSGYLNELFFKYNCGQGLFDWRSMHTLLFLYFFYLGASTPGTNDSPPSPPPSAVAAVKALGIWISKDYKIRKKKWSHMKITMLETITWFTFRSRYDAMHFKRKQRGCRCGKFLSKMMIF